MSLGVRRIVGIKRVRESRLKPICLSFVCFAIGTACASAAEHRPLAGVSDQAAAHRELVDEAVRSESSPTARMRMDRLSACFLSHVLQERIELACDEDLFFAPLHQSFYASRTGTKARLL